MRKRLIQIFGFLLVTLGWFFVSCTMAMNNWRISQIGGLGGQYVIKVGWYWSNLWKDCFVDSTDVTNCRNYGVLWPASSYIQGVRGLLLTGLALGFCGTILAFVGMECTNIGSSPKTNDRILFIAAVFHFVGGVSDTAGYCLYINQIVITAFNTNFDPYALQYVIGAPLFLGLVGSFFIVLGSVLYAVTVFRSISRKSGRVHIYESRTYATPRSRGRTLYSGYYMQSRPSQFSQYSRPYRNSTYSGKSRSSKISQFSSVSRIEDKKMLDRDTFV
ncbi:claudin-10-like [Scleropages formosus]|uniref:claudin-10-like n=1 Tax=Scleropages formosus TaxID=113540 RepID=UPI0008783C9C|nr:claudin-10-like [Scleropages formosus]